MVGASSQKQTKQNPPRTFSQCVKRIIYQKRMTGAEFAEECHISEATVSRMIRDDNDKGATYTPSDDVIIAICLAMGLGEEGYNQLKNAADPRRAVLMQALKANLDVGETNERLYDAGLPLLGSEAKYK